MTLRWKCAGRRHHQHRCDSLLKCKPVFCLTICTSRDISSSCSIYYAGETFIDNLFWWIISFGIMQGYHADTSKTFYCGTVDDDAKQLVEVGGLSNLQRMSFLSMWVGHFIIGYCLCLSPCQPLPKRRVGTPHTQRNKLFRNHYEYEMDVVLVSRWQGKH